MGARASDVTCGGHDPVVGNQSCICNNLFTALGGDMDTAGENYILKYIF